MMMWGGRALLPLVAMVLVGLPSPGWAQDSDPWGIDAFNGKDLPEQWRPLLPQCKQSLSQLLDGHPTELARNNGQDEQSVRLMLDVVQDPNVSMEQISSKYWTAYNALYPDAMMAMKAKLARSDDVGQAYIGRQSVFHLNFKRAGSHLGTIVQCKFSKLSGEPYLKSIGIGRVRQNADGQEQTVVLVQDVNWDFDYVKDGDPNLIDCTPDKLSTYQIPGCAISAVSKSDFDRPGAISRFSTALALLIEGQSERALKYFDGYLDLSPDSYHGFLHRGRTFAALSQFDMALADYEEALLINPAAFEIHFLKARVHLAAQQPDLALAELAIALKHQPQEPGLYEARALAHFQKAAFDSVLADLADVLRLKPDSWSAYVDRATVYRQIGRLPMAFAELDKLIAANPDGATGFLERGQLFLMQGDAGRAAQDLKIAADLDPKSAGARMLYGTALMMTGDVQAALPQLDQAIALNPKQPDAHRNRGTAYARLGFWGKAEADYTTAIQLKPDFIAARLDLVRAYTAQKKTAQIISGYEEILRIVPNTVDALNGLAWILATDHDVTLRNAERAVQLAERSIALAADNPFVRDTLAAAYAATGRFDDAVREQRFAIKGLRDQGQDTSEFETHLKAYQAHKPWRE